MADLEKSLHFAFQCRMLLSGHWEDWMYVNLTVGVLMP